MLKISQASATNCSVTLRLEGRLVGPWVPELRDTCETALAEKDRVELNMSEVEYVDRHGATLLNELRKRGALFLECPPFVAEQLKAIGR